MALSRTLRIAGGRALASTLIWALGSVGTWRLLNDAAVRPYFTAAAEPMPLLPWLQLTKSLYPAVWVLLAVASLWIVLDQITVAGAASEIADRGGGTSRLARWCTEAARNVGPLVRIGIVSMLLVGLGAFALKLAFRWLLRRSWRAGWTLDTELLLRAIEVLSMAGWLFLVGAWSTWCRLITVLDDRPRVRGTAVLVLRAFWRRPLGGPLVFVLAEGATTALLGAIIVAWRQSPPESAGGLAVLVLCWLLALCATALVWALLLERAAAIRHAIRSSE
jgi:hypothetical protein